MILAATDWLSVSITLLLILFVIVCIVMTLMILMQRPKQEGLGAAFGGGMTDQMFGARTTNVLQRGTVWFASLFFVLALTLAVLIGMKNKPTETVLGDETTAVAEEEVTTEIVEVPIDESLVTIPSLVDELPTTDDEPAVDSAGDNGEGEAPAEEPETVEELDESGTEENSEEP